jgi:hypothetical protein
MPAQARACTAHGRFVPEIAPAFAHWPGEEQEKAGKQGCEEADLEDRELSPEAFDNGVAARIACIGDKGEQNSVRHVFPFPGREQK